jgi:hypothetical protein
MLWSLVSVLKVMENSRWIPSLFSKSSDDSIDVHVANFYIAEESGVSTFRCSIAL